MSSSSQVFSGAQKRLAFVLSMIAGYVDAYDFITYATYLSFMSGNTTQTGSQIGQRNILAAMPAVLAIVFFVTGVFTGTFLTYSGARKSQRLMFALVASHTAGNYNRNTD